MYWDPDNYREYSETASKADYSDPAYYGQDTSKAPRSAQPVQSLDEYSGYASDPPIVNDYEPTLMSEYRSPASVEGYTVDAGTEQRDAAAQGSAATGKKRKRLAGLGGIGATIGAFLLKFQAVGLLLLKFGWAGISAVISIGVYSVIFGWQFAVGLVALLFIHEMGHALVMKLKGIPVGGMIFIPLLGAAVIMKQMPRNAKDEAEVGIAGPIAGALAASACLAVAFVYPRSVWASLAYFGFFMNLFNLIPIVPFDGGRVLAAIDRRVWIVGFLGLLAFQVWSWIQGYSNWFLLLFIILAAGQLWSRRTAADTPEAQAYYTVPISERIMLSLLYFGLAAVLVLGMSISRGLLTGIIR